MAAATFSKSDPPPSRLIPVKIIDEAMCAVVTSARLAYPPRPRRLDEDCVIKKIPQFACTYYPKIREIECEPFFRAMLACVAPLRICVAWR
jgi:hypothetical protein